MTALVRSELLKIRTTRGWWSYLIVLVLFSGVAVAGDIGPRDDLRRSSPEFQLGLVEVAGIAALLALILGITVVTTEFRHGTITPTFLAGPIREQVLVAKALAGAIVAVVFDLVSLAVIAAVATVSLRLVDAELHLASRDVFEFAAQTIFAALLWALMGIAIGSAVHSQVAAIVGTLIWIFVLENLLWGLFAVLDLDGAVPYLPFRALDAADGRGGDDLLGYGTGVLVSLAWIAAIGAAGVARTRRRDIT